MIEFLSRTDQQLAFYEASGNLPARTSAWDQSDRLGEDRWTRAFEEQLAHVVPPPRVPEWERIAQLIYQAGEAAVDDGQPIGATLDTLDRKVDAVLEKRRWMMKRVAKSE